MQLTWALNAQLGIIKVSLYGNPALHLNVDRADTLSAGASLNIYPTMQFLLPAKSLAISELFPGETVSFPFDALPLEMPLETRQSFAGCFGEVK